MFAVPVTAETTVGEIRQKVQEWKPAAADESAAEAGDEPASWLRPYAGALLAEMRAIEREAQQAMQHARHFEAAVEARVSAELVQQRQESLAPTRAAAATAAGGGAGAGVADGATAPHGFKRRVLAALALVALTAGAGAYLPASCLVANVGTALSPVAASVAAPIIGQAPTLLALVGAYHVTPPVTRALASAIGRVKAGLVHAGTSARGVLQAAEARMAEAVQAGEMWMGYAPVTA